LFLRIGIFFVHLQKNKAMTTTLISPKKKLQRESNNTLEEAPKKKLSYYQKKKAIDEIAQSINRNVTRRNLLKMILEE
jgi:hypothetical protein